MTKESIEQASDWLGAFLDCERYYRGGALPLRECMRVCGQDDGIRVVDECGCDHAYGTSTYEDAFLLALRDFVNAGRIEPVFDANDGYAPWAEWIAGGPLNELNRSNVFDIPLRYIPAPRDETEDARSPYDRAKDHLMGILKAEGSVRYSRFYDGTTETEDHMRNVCGVEEDDDTAEVLMDEVVWNLEKAGIVRKTDLREKLSDGENDYLIELTESTDVTKPKKGQP